MDEISQMMADEDECLAREQAALRAGAEHARKLILERIRAKAKEWQREYRQSRGDGARRCLDNKRVLEQMAAEIEMMLRG